MIYGLFGYALDTLEDPPITHELREQGNRAYRTLAGQPGSALGLAELSRPGQGPRGPPEPHALLSRPSRRSSATDSESSFRRDRFMSSAPARGTRSSCSSSPPVSSSPHALRRAGPTHAAWGGRDHRRGARKRGEKRDPHLLVHRRFPESATRPDSDCPPLALTGAAKAAPTRADREAESRRFSPVGREPEMTRGSPRRAEPSEPPSPAARLLAGPRRARPEAQLE